MKIDRQKFFIAFRSHFGALSQGQVDGLSGLLAAIESVPGILPTQAAYVLATAWHETARRMRPVRETLADSDDEAIRRLDRAWVKGRMPQVRRAYWRRDAHGQTWLGRGHVQLTHKSNYERASLLVDADLVAEPDLALDPMISAKILVQGALTGLFTGERLGDYVTPDLTDYKRARRVINGLDRADEIAAHARRFERVIKVSHT